MLKVVVDKLEDVDESLRDHYSETADGKFVLDLDEGGVRQHPHTLSLQNALAKAKAERGKAWKDLEDLRKKYAGVPEDFDAEEFERLRTEEKTRQEQPEGQDARKQVEAQVAARLQSAEARHQAALRKEQEAHTATSKRADAATQRLHRLMVDQTVTQELQAAGVTKPAALKAARALIASDVVIEDVDGEPAPRMREELGGDEVGAYVKNWIETEDGKFFVEAPRGAGAEGGGTGKRDGGPNPWMDGPTFNMTEQARIYRSDPAKAKRLAAAAGKKLPGMAA